MFGSLPSNYSPKRLPQPVPMRLVGEGLQASCQLLAADSSGGRLRLDDVASVPERFMLSSAPGAMGKVRFVSQVTKREGNEVVFRWLLASALERRSDLVAVLRGILGINAHLRTAEDAIPEGRELIYDAVNQQVHLLKVPPANSGRLGPVEQLLQTSVLDGEAATQPPGFMVPDASFSLPPASGGQATAYEQASAVLKAPDQRASQAPGATPVHHAVAAQSSPVQPFAGWGPTHPPEYGTAPQAHPSAGSPPIGAPQGGYALAPTPFQHGAPDKVSSSAEGGGPVPYPWPMPSPPAQLHTPRAIPSADALHLSPSPREGVQGHHENPTHAPPGAPASAEAPPAAASPSEPGQVTTGVPPGVPHAPYPFAPPPGAVPTEHGYLIPHYPPGAVPHYIPSPTGHPLPPGYFPTPHYYHPHAMPQAPPQGTHPTASAPPPGFHGAAPTHAYAYVPNPNGGPPHPVLIPHPFAGYVPAQAPGAMSEATPSQSAPSEADGASAAPHPPQSLQADGNPRIERNAVERPTVAKLEDVVGLFNEPETQANHQITPAEPSSAQTPSPPRTVLAAETPARVVPTDPHNLAETPPGLESDPEMQGTFGVHRREKLEVALENQQPAESEKAETTATRRARSAEKSWLSEVGKEKKLGLSERLAARAQKANQWRRGREAAQERVAGPAPDASSAERAPVPELRVENDTLDGGRQAEGYPVGPSPVHQAPSSVVGPPQTLRAESEPNIARTMADGMSPTPSLRAQSQPIDLTSKSDAMRRPPSLRAESKPIDLSTKSDVRRRPPSLRAESKPIDLSAKSDVMRRNQALRAESKPIDLSAKSDVMRRNQALRAESKPIDLSAKSDVMRRNQALRAESRPIDLSAKSDAIRRNPAGRPAQHPIDIADRPGNFSRPSGDADRRPIDLSARSDAIRRAAAQSSQKPMVAEAERRAGFSSNHRLTSSGSDAPYLGTSKPARQSTERTQPDIDGPVFETKRLSGTVEITRQRYACEWRFVGHARCGFIVLEAHQRPTVGNSCVARLPAPAISNQPLAIRAPICHVDQRSDGAFIIHLNLRSRAASVPRDYKRAVQFWAMKRRQSS